MSKKPTKTEITYAVRAINEQLDLINDIARTEGHTEARKCAMYGETVQRMRGAILILSLALLPLPERLEKNLPMAKQFGWA